MVMGSKSSDLEPFSFCWAAAECKMKLGEISALLEVVNINNRHTCKSCNHNNDPGKGEIWGFMQVHMQVFVL